MFRLVKQVIIVLLSVGGSLATICVSFCNEPCMPRPTLNHLNPLKLNYYSLMISLGKYNRNCNVVNDLSLKICICSKTKRGKS